MQNPVLQMIHGMGLSPRAFSVTYGCSLAAIRNAIYGYTDKVPKALMEALQKCGFDTSTLDAEYQVWLKFTFSKEVCGNG